ncbi:MAG: phosphoenolpyruvate carboxykinase (GTP) [Planctomycetes bacterium]|nr:phosphoenolpyruvate carboxykinase (GTP) [Planctomycetota bacterium]
MGHKSLEAWVEDVARLTNPAAIEWCDGSDAESTRINELLVSTGDFIRLNPEKHPNSFLARSDPSDVARVEDRTFICSRVEQDAGPTNNWCAPQAMHETLRPLLAGAMRQKTMYVVPYLLGPAGSPLSKVGVELTDSPYVVANLRIMTRMGQVALQELGTSGSFSRGLHAVGTLDPQHRYISHFPDENLVISVNSNYGGNALLSKKCFALRLASVLARDEGWLAEHMLILCLTDPTGRKTYICAAFPSACGKTNLAMLIPPARYRDAGWKVETIGDDIAWLKFGADGRLYAINPEAGFFGVAPGTSARTNPNAIAACSANTIFTNVALQPDGTVWWEGIGGTPPEHLIDWRGQPWQPGSKTSAAHPNSRFTAPAHQAPCISPDWERPEGVPISAIIFGGRRAKVMPLVYQAFNWQHGTYVGATMSSEKTAAAAGTVGELRRDPMAMLPFCGYHMADYWRHWLEVGQRGGEKMPKVFHVNWFRKDAQGKFFWPGFGESIRVLKWIAERCRGAGAATETPIGWLPTVEALDAADLGLQQAAVDALLRVDRQEWQDEAAVRGDYLGSFGDKLPAELLQENQALISRLG